MTTLETSRPDIRNSRLVLRNVPQVKFFDGGQRCPEDIPFPSVMRALMEYLGEEAYGCRSSTPSRLRAMLIKSMAQRQVASYIAKRLSRASKKAALCWPLAPSARRKPR